MLSGFTIAMAAEWRNTARDGRVQKVAVLDSRPLTMLSDDDAVRQAALRRGR